MRVLLQRIVVSLIPLGKVRDSPASSLLMLPDTLIPVLCVSLVISVNVYIFTMYIDFDCKYKAFSLFCKLFSVFFKVNFKMKGADLKEKLRTSRYSMAEIAKLIGVSPQNLNNSFGVEDVKSGLLEKLAEALEVPITFFYGDSYNVQGNNNAIGNNNAVNAADDRLLTLLISKEEQLTKAMEQTTKAMEQTSKAQEHMDIMLNVMKGNHNA
jgi:transcriptional regulator with XRE-family HTH domain